MMVPGDVVYTDSKHMVTVADFHAPFAVTNITVGTLAFSIDELNPEYLEVTRTQHLKYIQ